MANQTTKKAANSKAAKKKTTSRKEANQKGRRGHRYSDGEKATVVDFVNRVNAEKGRGGITAAVQGFGVTAITISKWLKGAGPSASKPTRGRLAKVSGGRDRVLAELTKLDQEIARARGELQSLEDRFEQLKTGL